MKQKKYILLLIFVSILIPVSLFIMGFGINNDIIENGIFEFILKVSSKTHFPEISNIYFLSVIYAFPVQITLLVWLLIISDARNFNRLKPLILKNDPLLKFGPLVILRQKYGIGVSCVVVIITIIFSIFFVGGDIYLCKGCEAQSKIVFIVANTIEVTSVLALSAFLGVWFKLMITTGDENAN